jgi:hypothetical protein
VKRGNRLLEYLSGCISPLYIDDGCLRRLLIGCCVKPALTGRGGAFEAPWLAATIMTMVGNRLLAALMPCRTRREASTMHQLNMTRTAVGADLLPSQPSTTAPMQESRIVMNFDRTHHRGISLQVKLLRLVESQPNTHGRYVLADRRTPLTGCNQFCRRRNEGMHIKLLGSFISWRMA